MLRCEFLFVKKNQLGDMYFIPNTLELTSIAHRHRHTYTHMPHLTTSTLSFITPTLACLLRVLIHIYRRPLKKETNNNKAKGS